MVKLNRQKSLESVADDENGGGSLPPSKEGCREINKINQKRGKRKLMSRDSDESEDDDEVDPDCKLTHRQIEEILHLHTSDHSGMQLVSAQLTGTNFLNWSRSIGRALAAKSKLEFTDGSFPEPNPKSKYYKRWLKVDYMVSNWITNSISKELVNAFSNIDNTQKLWYALNQRFGRCNGPKILKLQRKIFNCS